MSFRTNWPPPVAGLPAVAVLGAWLCKCASGFNVRCITGRSSCTTGRNCCKTGVMEEGKTQMRGLTSQLTLPLFLGLPPPFLPTCVMNTALARLMPPIGPPGASSGSSGRPFSASGHSARLDCKCKASIVHGFGQRTECEFPVFISTEPLKTFLRQFCTHCVLGPHACMSLRTHLHGLDI